MKKGIRRAIFVSPNRCRVHDSLTIVNGHRQCQLVPVFGCDCAACRQARLQENYRRPCSAAVKFNDAVTLLDAGIPHLMDDWPAGSFSAVLLTHYHMDHVQGLFPCAGALARRSPFTARRMKPDVTISSNTRAFWISAICWSRL